MIGSASTIRSSTLALLNPSAGIIISNSTALLTSIAILITNEYISKLKIRYTKSGDWINVYTLLVEKFLKPSMVDKKTNEKEVEQLKKIYNHYLDKRKEIMKNTEFKVEDIFGVIINKHNISLDQIIGLNTFLARMM